ncbi:hypothetical protein DPEC_G00280530 [Dallia pectoralis]|uniref:Uncharacterized protein n=1 Tax=Dallia pectoralis TaxID=75939 RepID=A0ACC2FMJ1_DALPE|nr:hypothetical protein DPEC_G00280530 [Dallia pectoralis]
MGLNALQDWCRISCENYPDVEIRNLSTSFRDGLAFCAIIHRYRPDLIDFNSLSKNNVYENNHLAFQIAESKLGIAALLDATEMVSTEVPDRLSIITYLSHYYYYFNKKPHDFQACLKTSSVAESFSPPKPQPDCPGGLKQSKSRTLEQSKRNSPCSVCFSCSKHVHLVQRHLSEGKLYHRTCFRCSVCGGTLLPGSYIEGIEAGTLACTQHMIASQNICPGNSKQTESTRNRDPFHVTGETDTGETVVCGRGQSETEGDERKTRQDTVEMPKPPRPPQTTAEAENLNGAQTQPVQWKETKSPDPGGLRLTPGRDLASGRPVWPVAAPRRVYNSTPLRPALRTCPPEVMGSPSESGNQVDCKTPAGSFHGGFCKSKSPPWMELVQPGPWPKLPPAPPPRMPKPPRSGSIPSLRGSWYRAKVPPPNPFGEFEDKDEAIAADDALYQEQAMVTSQTWCGASQLAEAASSHCPNLVDVSSGIDKYNVEKENDIVNVSEISGASKIDSLAEAGGLLPTSTLLVETSLVESADVGGVAKMLDAAGTLDVCHVADAGGLTKQAASSPGLTGLSNLTEAETTSVSYLAYGGSSKAARSLGVSDPNESGGLRISVVDISVSTVDNFSQRASSSGISEDSDSSLNQSSLAGADVTGAPSVLSTSDQPVSVFVPVLPSSLSSPCTKSNPPPACSTNAVAASPSLHRPLSLPSVSEVGGSGQAPLHSYSKQVCKANPFNRKVSLSEYPKSKPAPGHGFPLIKRKVQSDIDVPGAQQQVEMMEVRKRMDRLEQRGVEMESNLRDLHRDLEEEDMWADWFTLIHEKHVLVCRDTELVYMAKQQQLEERQADVEYELRCLLNKPECKWSCADRSRDQQLMEELVTIIEQRNRIIHSWDMDRQREKEEDMLLPDLIKKKEAGKDLKMLRSKFKPMKMLKMLSHKNSKSNESQNKS